MRDIADPKHQPANSCGQVNEANELLDKLLAQLLGGFVVSLSQEGFG